MSKLTYQNKLEIVKMKEQGILLSTIEFKYNINKQNIYKIFNLYKSHGIEALKVKKYHKTYSISEKLLIIKEVFNGNALNSVAIKYNLSYENIHRWI